MHECTLRLDDRLLKPGARVQIGPEDARFEGVIYRTEITLHQEGVTQVVYHVEWWDDRICHRNAFLRGDLEEVDR